MSATISQSSFTTITDVVIKQLEGGYYHPLMMTDGRMDFTPSLSNSGETMFGLDRKNGYSALGKSQAWKDFWAAIDKAGARTKWKWNYRGGNLENYLQTIAGQIMYPWFTSLYDKYLTSDSKAIIAATPGLKLHFAYAAWNGEGWFKTFANKFNDRVVQGTSNVKDLTNAAIKDRTSSSNSLIRQTGQKIAALIAAMSGPASFILPAAILIFLFGI